MDAPRVGRSLLVLRHRQGWRQADLAAKAGVSRERVSLVESGGAAKVSIGELCAMFEALDASVDVVIRWRAEALDRLLDGGHASLVDDVVTILTAAGWETAVEVTFNVFGERGAIDVLAWHAGHRVALVVEVKTVVPDQQAMLQTLDRKVRLAADAARGRGWKPRVVGRLLVVGEGRTARRRLAEHDVVLRQTFPVRGRAVRAWLRKPVGSTFAGLILLPVDPAKRVGRRRVRRKRDDLEGEPTPASIPIRAAGVDGTPLSGESEVPPGPWTERTLRPGFRGG